MIRGELNTGKSRIMMTLTILILWTISARGQELEPKGELRIYLRETQIGTIANREFKDDKGRVVKVVYYIHPDPSARPFREELMREQSTQMFEYDEHGCRIKTNTYGAGMNLRRIDEVRCSDGTAMPKLSTMRDSLGVRQRETRHAANGSTQTVLSFGSNGDTVVGINGQLPVDIDLADGWGDVFSGLALGIAGNRAKGRQQDLQVHVTIKNLSHDALVMIAPIKIELKDMSGRVFEQKANPNKSVEKQIQSGECQSYLQQGAPGPGMSQTPFSYDLGAQFEPLAPGRYSISVMYCVSGVAGKMVSNTIVVEVE